MTVTPAREPPATLHPQGQAFAGGWRLAGADYDAGVPGQGRIYLHWRRDAAGLLPRGPWRADRGAATVTALHGDAPVAAAALPALAPGEAATVALDVPLAGGEALRLQLTDADGASLPALGAWHLALRAGAPLRAPALGERYVPLGGEMAYVGLDDAAAVAAATAVAGGDVWLRPRFLALRPLTADYAVSVGLARTDLGWEQKVDGTPALGAIPTLKWVTGWLVRDAHVLSLAPDAPPGDAAITVGVYDAFTLAPLQVLDERLVRAGQGVQLSAGGMTIIPPAGRAAADAP